MFIVLIITIPDFQVKSADPQDLKCYCFGP